MQRALALIAVAGSALLSGCGFTPIHKQAAASGTSAASSRKEMSRTGP